MRQQKQCGTYARPAVGGALLLLWPPAQCSNTAGHMPGLLLLLSLLLWPPQAASPSSAVQ
jgi:hypothetical protein